LSNAIESPREQVLAQWRYSELLTRHEYDNLDYVRDLRAVKTRRTNFNALDPKDHAVLLRAWEDVRGGNSVFNVALQNVRMFQLIEWTREQLGNVYVIPHFVLDMLLAAGSCSAPGGFSELRNDTTSQ
jgi:hypothetical protein